MPLTLLLVLQLTVSASGLPGVVVERNFSGEGAIPTAVVDSLLAGEQLVPTAQRVGDWAARLAATPGLEYRFGLADGGYVAEGRLDPGRRFDCIALVYRTCELARARSARHALAVAMATRFAGAVTDSVYSLDGRVDYDRPEHLDYALDMIRSGHWGVDVTSSLSGAATDSLGTKRVPAGSVDVVPEALLHVDELQHGDLVWLVLSPDDPAALGLRQDHGLMVGHAGVVVVRQDERCLVHAASRPLPGWYAAAGVVEVSLTAYLTRVERYDAIIVTRFP